MIPANSSNGRDSVARRIYGLNETLFCIRTTEIGALKKKLGNRKGNLPKRAILKVIRELVLISKDECRKRHFHPMRQRPWDGAQRASTIRLIDQ